MKAIAKVEKNGIPIPMEKLKELNEGDIVKIEIEKVYVGEEVKKELSKKGLLVFQ